MTPKPPARAAGADKGADRSAAAFDETALPPSGELPRGLSADEMVAPTALPSGNVADGLSDAEMFARTGLPALTEPPPPTPAGPPRPEPTPRSNQSPKRAEQPPARTPAKPAPPKGAVSADHTPQSIGLEATVSQDRNTLGRYRNLVLLGAGGMGVVYKALDPSLNRQVAIKLMNDTSDEFRARFAREAMAMARLSSPRIVQVYDYGEAEDTHNPYFVMELIRGRSLAEALKEKGKFSVPEVIRVLRQAAEGLAAAHKAGIVHRDIKPANIMLDDVGNVKVVDFGIAHVEEGVDPLTTPNALMGTPHYMAPEMLSGKIVDERADIYALGLTGFHLLTGQAPFRAANAMAVAMMHLKEPLPPIAEKAPGTPPGLISLIEAMSEKERERRIKSCDEILASLDQLDRAPTQVMRRPMPISRPVVLGLAAGFALLLTSAGILSTRVLKSHRGGALLPEPPPKIEAVATAGQTAATPKEPTQPTTSSVAARERPREFERPLRLAIVDFRNLGSEKDLDSLSGGIGESLLTELSQDRERIRVIERTQLQDELKLIDFEQTKYVDPTLRAALGKIAGAKVAVFGAYQRSGGRLRITARIVYIETGDVLDAITLTRPTTDLLAVQDEAVAEVHKRVIKLLDAK